MGERERGREGEREREGERGEGEGGRDGERERGRGREGGSTLESIALRASSLKRTRDLLNMHSHVRSLSLKFVKFQPLGCGSQIAAVLSPVLCLSLGTHAHVGQHKHEYMELCTNKLKCTRSFQRKCAKVPTGGSALRSLAEGDCGGHVL